MSLFQHMKRKQRGHPLRRFYASRLRAVDSSHSRSCAAVTPIDEFDIGVPQIADRNANSAECLQETEHKAWQSCQNMDQDAQEDEDLVSEEEVIEPGRSLMTVSKPGYGSEDHEDDRQDQEKFHHYEKNLEVSDRTRRLPNRKGLAKTSAFVLMAITFICIGKVPTVLLTLAMAVGCKLYSRNLNGKTSGLRNQDGRIQTENSDGSKSSTISNGFSKDTTHYHSLQNLEGNKSDSTPICVLSPDLEALQLELGSSGSIRQLRRLNCMRITPDSPTLKGLDCSPSSSSSTTSGPTVFSLDDEFSGTGTPARISLDDEHSLTGLVNVNKKDRIGKKILAHLRKKNKPQSAPTTPLKGHHHEVQSIFKTASDNLQAIKNADKQSPAHGSTQDSSKPYEIARKDDHQASTPGNRKKTFGKSPLKPVFSEETRTAASDETCKQSPFIHNVSILDGESVGKPLYKNNTKPASTSDRPRRGRPQIASTVVVITAGLLMGRTFAIFSLVCYFYTMKAWSFIMRRKLNSA